MEPAVPWHRDRTGVLRHRQRGLRHGRGMDGVNQGTSPELWRRCMPCTADVAPSAKATTHHSMYQAAAALPTWAVRSFQRPVSAVSAAQATVAAQRPRRGVTTHLPDAYVGGVKQMMRMKTARIVIARGSRRLLPLAALVAAGAVLPATAGVASADAHGSTYRQVNLVSDVPGLAPTDPDSCELLGSFRLSGHRPGTGRIAVGVGQRDGQDHPVHLGKRQDRQQVRPGGHDHLRRADRPGVQRRQEPERLRRA